MPDQSSSQPPSHSVTVERQRLRFAAGHFATFADELEPIHGHNYDVFVEVTGPLTEESWVIDFSLLKKLTREVCESLDHKFLLQMDSRTLTITDDDTHYIVQYKDEHPYRLPKHDVAPLPIDNSTAERLSQFIAGRLIDSLELSGPSGLARLRVGVEEMPGQAAWFETQL
jgi:6-pyruvoyltetrahydropterin/6-carboxytetrahydropterin synthase